MTDPDSPGRGPLGIDIGYYAIGLRQYTQGTLTAFREHWAAKRQCLSRVLWAFDFVFEVSQFEHIAV